MDSCGSGSEPVTTSWEQQ